MVKQQVDPPVLSNLLCSDNVSNDCRAVDLVREFFLTPDAGQPDVDLVNSGDDFEFDKER